MERTRFYCPACKAAHVPTDLGCSCPCHTRAGHTVLNRAVEHLAQSGLPRASAELAGMADVLLAEEAPPRLFPMQNGPPIPWSLAEQIYVKLYIALNGAGQSLSRLAELGGFGWAEVAFMWREYEQRFGQPPHWEV